MDLHGVVCDRHYYFHEESRERTETLGFSQKCRRIVTGLYAALFWRFLEMKSFIRFKYGDNIDAKGVNLTAGERNRFIRWRVYGNSRIERMAS